MGICRESPKKWERWARPLWCGVAGHRNTPLHDVDYHAQFDRYRSNSTSVHRKIEPLAFQGRRKWHGSIGYLLRFLLISYLYIINHGPRAYIVPFLDKGRFRSKRKFFLPHVLNTHLQNIARAEKNYSGLSDIEKKVWRRVQLIVSIQYRLWTDGRRKCRIKIRRVMSDGCLRVVCISQPADKEGVTGTHTHLNGWGTVTCNRRCFAYNFLFSSRRTDVVDSHVPNKSV